MQIVQAVLVLQQGGHQSLVITNFVRSAACTSVRLCWCCRGEGIRYVRLDGSTSAKKRARVMQEFASHEPGLPASPCSMQAQWRRCTASSPLPRQHATVWVSACKALLYASPMPPLEGFSPLCQGNVQLYGYLPASPCSTQAQWRHCRILSSLPGQRVTA